jgi:hypothetical protein
MILSLHRSVEQTGIGMCNKVEGKNLVLSTAKKEYG